MLKLEVKAKDLLEMRRKVLKASKDLFELEEQGKYDDSSQEWVHRREEYTIDYTLADTAHKYDGDPKKSLDELIEEEDDDDDEFTDEDFETGDEDKKVKPVQGKKVSRKQKKKLAR